MNSIVPDVRIVLLGKTGSGKSSAGNTILGKRMFKEGIFSESMTSQCEKHEVTVDDKTISVIDTPGLFHTSLTEDDLKAEVERCLSLSGPGPHVFLLVIRVGRFTEEERNTVEWIQKNFGEEALNFTMLLFTGGDLLEETPEILNHCPDVNKIRIQHIFNNREKEDRTQVTELLEKIQSLVQSNGEMHYTTEMFQEAQRKLEEEEEERRKNNTEKKKENVWKRIYRGKHFMLMFIAGLITSLVLSNWNFLWRKSNMTNFKLTLL